MIDPTRDVALLEFIGRGLPRAASPGARRQVDTTLRFERPRQVLVADPGRAARRPPRGRRSRTRGPELDRGGGPSLCAPARHPPRARGARAHRRQGPRAPRRGGDAARIGDPPRRARCGSPGRPIRQRNHLHLAELERLALTKGPRPIRRVTRAGEASREAGGRAPAPRSQLVLGTELAPGLARLRAPFD